MPQGSDPRYGWTLVGVFAVTEMVSWGVLYYAFAVFMPVMQHDLDWSRTEISGAFSVALATSALAAFAVGRWLDRRSPRFLMTAGSLGGSLLVLAWSRVHDLGLFYLVWACIGLAMACVLYEPAFVVITKWFRHQRWRALTAITLVGGLGNFVFSPLSNWLIHVQGWRSALVTLAVILAVTTVPLHAFFLKSAPDRDGHEPYGIEPSVATRAAVSSSAFWCLTGAFVLSSFAISAVTVNLIPYLLEGGQSAGFAAFALGLMGLMQVVGRLAYAGATKTLPRHHVASAVFLLQAIGLGALAAVSGEAGVVVAACLLGAGNGMVTLVRPVVLSDAYGSASFGSIAGVAAACATGARAVAPVAVAAASVALGGYRPVFWLLAAGLIIATLSARVGNRQLVAAPGAAPSAEA